MFLLEKYRKESMTLTLLFSMSRDSSCKVRTNEDKGMWRAREDQFSVPSAGLAGVFQPESEHKSGLKIQERTQGFGPNSKAS